MKMSRFFSKSVRGALAAFCVFSTVSPAFGKAWYETVETILTNNGTNMSQGNRVNSASGARVIDYHVTPQEGFVDAIAGLVGVDTGISELKNISCLYLESANKVGVIHWNKLNVDDGKTMYVVPSAWATGGTLYNIVDGGSATSIAGKVRSQLDSNVLTVLTEVHDIFKGAIANPGGNVNMWIINPAGVSFSGSADVNLNGYLGLVAGKMTDAAGLSSAGFNTEGASGSITIESGATMQVHQLFMVGNKIDVQGYVPCAAYAAAGPEVTFNGYSLSAAQRQCLDEMSISGNFGGSLYVDASDKLTVGDLKVNGEAWLVSRMGDITLNGTVKLYGITSSGSIKAENGSITLSSGSLGADGQLEVTAGKDVMLDGSGNRFLDSLTVKAIEGSVVLSGEELTSHNLYVSAGKDISLIASTGSINLNSGWKYSFTMGEESKLSLESKLGSISVSGRPQGWNGRFGDLTAGKGTITVSDYSGQVQMLGAVNAQSVDVSARGLKIVGQTQEDVAQTFSATVGDINLNSIDGVDISGNLNMSAKLGNVNIANQSSGEVVIGSPFASAGDDRVKITGRNVSVQQLAKQDLAIEESAVVTATAKTSEDTGIRVEYGGDLYVFGELTQSIPDESAGFNEDGTAKSYLLPTIISTPDGEGYVRAMSFNMHGRNYKLSNLNGDFGTWAHLEYMRLYNLGTQLDVDQDVTLVTALPSSRTGNRTSFLFESIGDMTLSFDHTTLDAKATGLTIGANGGEGKIHLVGDGGKIETGDRVLTFSGRSLDSDNKVTIKASTMAFGGGIDVDLAGNDRVFVDAIMGKAGDIALKANAYLDEKVFRLAGDLSAGTVELDTAGAVNPVRRDFIGGSSLADDATSAEQLYTLDSEVLRIGLKEDAKLYVKSSKELTIEGLEDEPGVRPFTTAADFRFATPQSVHLEGNQVSRSDKELLISNLGTARMKGEVYLRETVGSMTLKQSVRTDGSATLIANGDNGHINFATEPNDIRGQIKIGAGDLTDVDFVNYSKADIAGVSGNNVKLTSVNNDITIAGDAAFVKGVLSLSAEKGKITVNRQGNTEGLWSGKLGETVAQGEVKVATARKLTLVGDLTAGDATLEGDLGIDSNNHLISLTDQNRIPDDEYAHRTTGQLTAYASMGAVKLANANGTAHDVVAFAAKSRDGVEFRNSRALAVKDVLVTDGDALIESADTITLEGSLVANHATLHASQGIEFGEQAIITASVGTKLMADNADLVIDLDALGSCENRKKWKLGTISAEAGTAGARRDVTIVGQEEETLLVGDIRGENVRLIGKEGVSGAETSMVRAGGEFEVVAEAGDISLRGQNYLVGKVAAKAEQGSVSIWNETTLKVDEIVASSESGKIALSATSIVSPDNEKSMLSAKEINLAATADINLSVAGSLEVNKLNAYTATIRATDDGASLIVKNGSVDRFAADVARNLEINNSRSLALDRAIVGGDMLVDVAGNLTQSGVADAEGRIDVAGDSIFIASGAIRLDNPYNKFGSTIEAEAGTYAVFASAGEMEFDYLKAVDAELYTHAGDIVVNEGHINTLIAKTEESGRLGVINGESLILREIDVDAMALLSTGDITGDETIRIRSNDGSYLVADGKVSLTASDNELGSSLTVKASDAKLVNNGAMMLESVVSGNVDYRNVGDLTVSGETIASGKIVTENGDLMVNVTSIGTGDFTADGDMSVNASTIGTGNFTTEDGNLSVVASVIDAGAMTARGGNLQINAGTIANAAAPLKIAADGTIDVAATGDAALHRTDGGWTLGSGGHLQVGGDLALTVEGILGTDGDGIVAAGGDIYLKALGYNPQVALHLGGNNFEVDRTAAGQNPQWAMFKTRGGNENPRFTGHDGVWVILNGRVTPTHPDYCYITTEDQIHMLSTPVLNPVAPVFGTTYLFDEGALGAIDLVGLARNPQVTYDNSELKFTTKE